MLETQLLTASIETIGAINADVVVVTSCAILHGAQSRRALRVDCKDVSLSKGIIFDIHPSQCASYVVIHTIQCMIR